MKKICNRKNKMFGDVILMLEKYVIKKIKEIKTREMPIYDRNESIITDKLSFVKSKREKNSKIKLPAFRQEDACL